LSFQLAAQNKDIDSLKQLFVEESNDTIRLELLTKIAFGYINYNSDSARFYIEKAKSVNNEINSALYKTDYLLTMASLYNIEMQNDSAIYFTLKALEISTENNFAENKAYAYLKLGLIYFSLTDYKRAIEYYQKAQNEYKALSDTLSIAICSSNIANVYLKTGHYDSSLICYKKSLKDFNSIQANTQIAITYANIGIIWFYKGNYKKAINYYKNALDIDLLLFNKKNTAISYINIGEAQIYLKQYSKSEKNLLEGYKIAKEIQAKRVELSSLEYLYILYKNKNDFKNALSFHEKYKALNDSLFNSKKNLQIIEIQTRFETKEQENKNRLLLADNRLKKEELDRTKDTKMALLALVFMAIIIIAILLWNKTNLQSYNKQISGQNKIISDQNEELQHYQILLEEKINKRTLELETALIKATESDRLKSEFLENISHEIRTPMNAIQGFSEILETNKKTDTNYTSIVQENIDQLLNLMDNLLDLSKFKAGQYKLKINSFSLPKMLENLKKDTFERKKQLQKQKIDINFVCDKNIPEEFITDEHKVFKIYQEILNNALKYTEKGHIDINCKHADNKLTITIKDTGIGIKSEKLPFIFEAFNKINIEEKRYRGTGIGLAIVNSSITALNGSITANSTKGEGSTFTIVIPNLGNKKTIT
jgi:signal transduction histidine kinase/tetratricopeptide (TPR) repeat protein